MITENRKCKAQSKVIEIDCDTDSPQKVSPPKKGPPPQKKGPPPEAGVITIDDLEEECTQTAKQAEHAKQREIV